MSRQGSKRLHPTCTWGRGVTAAQQTFNLHGEGSNLSDPIPFRLKLDEQQALVVQRQRLRLRKVATWVQLPPGAFNNAQTRPANVL